MNINEQVDLTFMALYNKQEPIIYKSLLSLLGNNDTDAIRCLETIEKIGFASKSKNMQASMGANTDIFNYSINMEGVEFIKDLPDNYTNKPYQFYLKNKEEEKLKAKAKEDLTDKKLDIDYKIAKRVYDSYKLTRIFAWIGAITGTVALLLKLAELFGILTL